LLRSLILLSDRCEPDDLFNQVEFV
jgi:hypothetical protein